MAQSRWVPARVVRILFERGVLLGLAVLALYLWIAPAHVIDGDNAEFCTLGALGGAAHPPGYPLFVLYLRATSWLPGGPAHAASLATALLGAVSIVILHAACRAWGARPLAATLACAIYAGAPVVMSIYTEAEVFALNGVIVGGVVWLAAAGGPLRGAWRAFALGLVAGLGLANQLTCVFVAPIGILGVVRAAREARPRVIALAALGLVLGLVPYLYLLIAPVHEASWGDLHGLGDVVHMFLRLDYGGPTNLATARADVPALTSLGALAYTVGRTWLVVPALAGIAALVARIARPGDGEHETRWAWALLAASIAIAGPLLVSRFNIAPEGPGRWVVDRFHLLPSLLLALPVADALDRALSRAPQIEARGALAHVVAVIVFVAVAAPALPHVARMHAPAVEYQAKNLLASLPDRAVLIGGDDDVGGGVFYEQLVMHERPDVSYLHAPLFGLPWYRARLYAQGFASDGLIDDAMQKGRAVFIQATLKDAIAAFPHYRYGIVMRLLPRGTEPPPVEQVAAINEALYSTFELPYARPGEGDEWAAAVHTRYARAWQVIAAELEAAGKHAQAEHAAELAREIGPEP